MIYPIDKTNIDILRFVHFLAIAWLVRLAVPADAAFLEVAGLASHFADAANIPCRYSASARFWRSPPRWLSAHYEDSIVSQIVVSIVGIAIMCLAAYGAAWFKAAVARALREDAA